MDTTKDNFRPCSQFASGHEAVIRTEKLTKRFGSFTAVDGISFSVAPGEIFGFLGANGAGKEQISAEEMAGEAVPAAEADAPVAAQDAE